MSSTVASAKLMQVLADDGMPAFALKGGTLLQYRLELDSRAAEAEAAGRPARRLPARVVAYPHWANDYERAASSAGLELTLETAVKKVNIWLELVLNTNNGTAHA